MKDYQNKEQKVRKRVHHLETLGHQKRTFVQRFSIGMLIIVLALGVFLLSKLLENNKKELVLDETKFSYEGGIEYAE